MYDQSVSKFIKLLGVILFATSVGAMAQDGKFNLGFSSSLDYNSYGAVDNIGLHDFKGMFNYSGGIVVRYKLKDRFSFSAKALYSTKNFKREIDFSKLDPGPNTDPAYNQVLRTTYLNGFIDIPFDVCYTLYNRGSVELISSVGLVNSFMIDQNIEANYEDASNDWRYNKYLLSAKFGFGIMKRFQKVGIYLEPQFRFYLNDVYVSDWPVGKPVHLGIEIQVIKL